MSASMTGQSYVFGISVPKYGWGDVDLTKHFQRARNSGSAEVCVLRHGVPRDPSVPPKTIFVSWRKACVGSLLSSATHPKILRKAATSTASPPIKDEKRTKMKVHMGSKRVLRDINSAQKVITLLDLGGALPSYIQ